MSDMGEVWVIQKELSKQRRSDNRDKSTQILIDRDIEFETRNAGAHLIVTSPTGTIDFWPGTGKWIRRKGGAGRGVFSMIKHMSITTKL